MSICAVIPSNSKFKYSLLLEVYWTVLSMVIAWGTSTEKDSEKHQIICHICQWDELD
jgi:hypothetical protein